MGFCMYKRLKLKATMRIAGANQTHEFGPQPSRCDAMVHGMCECYVCVICSPSPCAGILPTQDTFILILMCTCYARV